MEFDTASSLLCIGLSLAGGFVILLLVGSYATQAIADAATDTTRATTTRGFQVLQPSTASPQPVLPISDAPPLSPATGPLRYVVLHHTGISIPHYDLMFEIHPGARLATWRSSDWPLEQGTLVERLADHRRDYLDYEGPVSNDRGHVTRVLAGTFHLEAASDDLVIVAAEAYRRFTFRREGETSLWRVELGPA
jgi:hypothetical protein